MKKWKTIVPAVLGVASLALAAQQAQAACGWPGAASAKPALFKGTLADGFLKTGFLRVADQRFGAPITGLWKVVLDSDGTGTEGGPPNGVEIDAGYAAWHADGTELMNSGRAPVSGNFCMGVWKQIGPLTYKLNHWALGAVPAYMPGVTNSWDQVGGVDQAFALAGPSNISETVTLSPDGNHFTGSFTLKAYAPDPSTPDVTDYDTNIPPFVINGTITGTRVTVD